MMNLRPASPHFGLTVSGGQNIINMEGVSTLSIGFDTPEEVALYNPGGNVGDRITFEKIHTNRQPKTSTKVSIFSTAHQQNFDFNMLNSSAIRALFVKLRQIFPDYVTSLIDPSVRTRNSDPLANALNSIYLALVNENRMDRIPEMVE